ncbi:RNA polymerase sigma-70 factor [Flavobacterium procerum]|uniref:RNA polymerase sigma-70 factor n=1 Tax=Flavobacterium procerum TaxID=1455569 RepID=A0ABV6BYN2_9FLAO
MIITDDEILQRLRAGDKKALTILYDSHWKPLFASSYLLLKDRELCEEIMQDVFIDLWNRRSDLQIKISFKSYLYACVRYKVFAEFRKDKPERIELYDDINARFQYATPETRMIHEELEHHINLIVESLPEKCQLVFKLSRNELLSHKEIAEQLGISTKTVENHITNALRVLRDSLGNVLSVEVILHFIMNR